MKFKRVAILVFVVGVLIVSATSAFAAKAGKGNLFYDGGVVRTVVPPASMPHEGVDNFYVVSNPVEGQLGIAAVAPGDQDYHGGKWKFYEVTFDNPSDATLLTSEQAVLDAEEAGLVTITRIADNDFKCPIQPNNNGK